MLCSCFTLLRNRRQQQSLLLAGLVVHLTACNALTSALTVQPGKQFELGGNQNGAFTVQAKNVGDVAVTISERRAGGQRLPFGTFRPGAQQTLRFSSGSTAIIDNPSDKPARLDLVVTGDTNLSMKETQQP